MKSAASFCLKSPVALIGLGVSNESVKRFGLSQGLSENDFIVFEDSQGEKGQAKVAQAASYVVSPGYPLNREWLTKLPNFIERKTSELAIAFDLLKQRKSAEKNKTEQVIGVTGSLGKSTTVTLLHRGLLASGKKSVLCGNIGAPLLDYVMASSKDTSLLADYIVLELSSYQLENCGNLDLDVSCISNLSPNHLSRYPSLDAYYRQKLEIIERTKTAVFLNTQSPELVRVLKGRSDSRFKWYDSDRSKVFAKIDFSNKALVGQHNEQNLEAAAQILQSTGAWSEKSRKEMLAFRGLPHRLEKVTLSARGPTVVNDSKSTSIDGVKIALDCVESERSSSGKLLLLLGGQDKELPWKSLSQLPPNSEVIFFGEVGEKAKCLTGLPGKVFGSLAETLKSLVPSNYSSDDWILLSPGGTSFDEFKNFEERGTYFEKRIQEIWN